MGQVIYKYEIPQPDEDGLSIVMLPGVYRLLHVDAQGDQLCLWALVEPTIPVSPVRLKIISTGHPFEKKGLRHLGTVLTHDALVWHVFCLDALTRVIAKYALTETI